LITLTKSKQKASEAPDDEPIDLDEIKFADVIECSLHSYTERIKSSQIIYLIKSFQEKAKEKIKKSDKDFLSPQDLSQQLDFKPLFMLFVKHRKITLLRHLLGEQKPEDFTFTGHLFADTLEAEAYDIGALLHKEFFRTILLEGPDEDKDTCCGGCDNSCFRAATGTNKDKRRNSSKNSGASVQLQNEKKEKAGNAVIRSLDLIVSSFNKNSGMIDYKCYLARKFQEKFLLKHARAFLDNLSRRVAAKNKENIFILNCNPVKAACQLIELLEGISYRFHQLKVRVQTIRGKI